MDDTPELEWGVETDGGRLVETTLEAEEEASFAEAVREPERPV